MNDQYNEYIYIYLLLYPPIISVCSPQPAFSFAFRASTIQDLRPAILGAKALFHWARGADL